MWTAVLATLNVLDGTSHDVWSVNLEENYLEEGSVVAAVLDSELATYRPRVKAHERPALSLALAHQTPQ